ncbi:hypothetical protein [Mesorhizobium sp. M1227]|uniref:hypothetical protein n=1 Tax=Mesorhizobium sp. M1227 TaxID=2957071 RepID=UPI00333DE451
MNGMKSQDIVVLLKLVSLQEQEGQIGSGELHWSFSGEAPYSVRGLESLLGISKTRSTLRSSEASRRDSPSKIEIRAEPIPLAAIYTILSATD